MRLLLINHEFTVSGSSTAFLRLALRLKATGHDVTLFAVNPADGPIKPHYAEAGIPVAARAVASDYDAAVLNTICAAPVLLQLASHVPTIWFVNEAEVALRLLLANPTWVEAFSRAAAVIFNMPFQRDVLRSFTYAVDPARIHVVPFGVDVERAVLRRDRVPAKSRSLRIVQVGTIEPRKRPGDLIRAAALSGLDLECVVCGTFYSVEPEAQALVDANPDRFRLLSGLADEEVLAWVASADVFCLVSASETQALAVYEAAQLGRPLVLTDLACYRDIFRHGRECVMVPPGHIEMLAGSLRMLAASRALREDLGRAAERAAAPFTNARFFARFEAVLRDATARPR